jgi:uncharacterized membrane protein
MPGRSEEVKKSTRPVGAANVQSRVNWGKHVRTRQLQSQRPRISSPEFEQVIVDESRLPSAPEFRDYEAAYPGTADRILSLLEREVLHEQAIEMKQVDAEIAQAKRKSLFTFATHLAAVLGCVLLLWSGQNLAAALAFLPTIAELIRPSVAEKIRHGKTKQKNLQQLVNAASQPECEEVTEDVCA